MESRKRLLRSRPQDRLPLHARTLRRLPAPCRVRRASAREGPRPGPRKQRRFPPRPLRSASPRFLRKQNLRRRPSRRRLRPIPSASERLAPARSVAGLRHHFSRTAFRRRRQTPPPSPHHPLPQRPASPKQPPTNPPPPPHPPPPTPPRTQQPPPT